jgi:hypothetical protein
MGTTSRASENKLVKNHWVTGRIFLAIGIINLQQENGIRDLLKVIHRSKRRHRQYEQLV